MRPPLPPELIQLGDQLEAAAQRALAERRARRQQALNVVASLVVVVPLVASVLATQATGQGPATTLRPTLAPTPTATAKHHGPVVRTRRAAAAAAAVPVAGGAQTTLDDLPAGDLCRVREAAPHSTVLLVPSSHCPPLR